MGKVGINSEAQYKNQDGLPATIYSSEEDSYHSWRNKGLIINGHDEADSRFGQYLFSADKKLDKNLKVALISIWVFVIALLTWPNIAGGMAMVELSLDPVARSGNDGLILEPMRPVSERIGVTSVLSYPTMSAPNVDGYYLSGSFVTNDVRVAVLQQYLMAKSSPMAPYAPLIVSASDENLLDYRVFASISGVESGFGQMGYAARIGYNPIGWRGGIGGKFNIFSSWDESIPYLISRLSTGYGQNFDPYSIQGRYCPPCEAAGTNEWARGVEKYMNEIDYLMNSI